MGDAFYYVIFMFMVKKITGSSAMVGFVGAASSLPYLVFSLYGGVVADRVDRRKIMLFSDLACGGIQLGFSAVVFLYSGKPPTPLLLLVPLLLTTTRVFFMPAKNAAIPALVPKSMLASAIAISATTQSVMPMISLALSATILAILYDKSPGLFFGFAVVINSLSFFGSAWFVARLPAILPARDAASHDHPWSDLKAGMVYVRSRRPLAIQIGLNAIFALCVSPFFVVYVAANDRWFGGLPKSLAWFECAFFVGLAVSYPVVGRLNIRKPGQGFIWGLGAVGAGVCAMAVSQSFWPFLAWQLFCGLAIPFADIPVTTWKGLTVPDAFRGRVNSLQSMVQSGMQPIGLSLGGVLVDRAGLVATFLLMGSGMVLACLAGLLDAEFRRLELPAAPTDSGDPEPHGALMHNSSARNDP